MYNSDIAVSDSSLVAASALVGSILATYGIILLLITIAQIVAMWKVYSEAGEAGWKSLIPIYNTVVLFRISGLSPWLVLVYLTSIIPFIGWIAILVLTIVQANKLSKSFGKDIGYTIGLIFLPTIFYMILGFGNASYVGPGGEDRFTNISNDNM